MVTECACTDLEDLGAYAHHIPSLRNLLTGETPTPIDDDSWQSPARELIDLARRRLGVSTLEPHRARSGSPDRLTTDVLLARFDHVDRDDGQYLPARSLSLVDGL